MIGDDKGLMFQTQVVHAHVHQGGNTDLSYSV